MARVTVEDCTALVENRFALCILAVKRARQLMTGAGPIVDAMDDKPPVTSLREIATGNVRFDRNVRDVLSGKYDPPGVAWPTRLRVAGCSSLELPSERSGAASTARA